MRRFLLTRTAAGMGAVPAVQPCALQNMQRFQSTNEGRGSVPPALGEAIDAIIKKDRIVVFLTGTPEQPRCRFTVATVDILRQLGVKYSYFNILDDDEICEGLKEHSGWPTYPQVYVDGDLIGGYDVCKKMLLDGDLTKMLKEKNLL